MANRLKKESNRNRNNDKIQCQLKKMVLRSNKEFLRYKKKGRKEKENAAFAIFLISLKFSIVLN